MTSFDNFVIFCRAKTMRRILSQESQSRKTKRRYRPGTKALMEIRKYQKSTVRLIQRAPFLRVVKDLLHQVSRKNDLRIQSDAVSALQEVSIFG